MILRSWQPRRCRSRANCRSCSSEARAARVLTGFWFILRRFSAGAEWIQHNCCVNRSRRRRRSLIIFIAFSILLFSVFTSCRLSRHSCRFLLAAIKVETSRSVIVRVRSEEWVKWIIIVIVQVTRRRRWLSWFIIFLRRNHRPVKDQCPAANQSELWVRLVKDES